jgi:hypothetical protein
MPIIIRRTPQSQHRKNTTHPTRHLNLPTIPLRTRPFRLPINIQIIKRVRLLQSSQKLIRWENPEYRMHLFEESVDEGVCEVTRGETTAEDRGGGGAGGEDAAGGGDEDVVGGGFDCCCGVEGGFVCGD